ncbi:MAG: hypothetical protein AB1772_11560 [Candidatus Zixiibacteriota bacterium]
MTRRLFAAASLAGLLALVLAASVGAKSDTRVDQDDARRLSEISRFNVIGPHPWMGKVTDEPVEQARTSVGTVVRRPIGSAQSPDVGIGVGVSVALTFDDGQYPFPIGRQVKHYWNGEVGENLAAGVHFAYELCSDTVPGNPIASKILSGYNVYDASVPSANWPRDQDVGCGLQSTDTAGTGQWVNLDVLGNTYAVLTARTAFFTRFIPTPSPGSWLKDNLLFYQGAEFSCTYDPRSSLNTSYIDSTNYRAHFALSGTGNYSVLPEVATQFDGSNTVVHVLLGEQEPVDGPVSDSYVTGASYRKFIYYRKLGDLSSSGSWSSGVIIDSIMQVYSINGVTIAPSPNSGKVCVSYSNPGYWGCLLDDQNSQYDTDVFYRESSDYGLTWAPKVNITNYQNAIAGDPAHFKAWVESPCLYDANDDLHIIWTGTATSADPYFDGFNWNDFDTDVYHWARSTDEIVKVAKGTYLNEDMLTGSINTLHCGFGGVHSGYIAFIWLSECDGKLYCVWNQMHELANHGDYTADPTLLEDCAYTGTRRSQANWEIMMSVARINSSSLWDAARHVSGAGAGTHTPECGVAGDPQASSVCGNEFKPSVEMYGLNEAGMGLTWPSGAIVDLSPGATYSGDYYLNMEYMDDQFPGYFVQDLNGRNDVGVLNSEKWVRLACVEPVEASLINSTPKRLEWPRWVPLGSTSNMTITVINEGNVQLNVTEIGSDDGAGAWLGTSASSLVVTAGVNNTATFDVVFNTAGLSQTQWLDGEVWLKSDAANFDSLTIPIHVLAATSVEAVKWDTVTTHQYMFDPFFDPEGEVVALAVGNFGELGYAAFSQGEVNLDYSESGLECGGRARDEIYLYGGTAFTILADNSSGANAVLSQVHGDANQGDETGFDPTPAKGSITGGTAGSGAYDSVYTGQFVNRDTTIAMERIVYGPRSNTPLTATLDFVVVYTKVYSADGQAHNHLAFGNACDYDIPASEPPNNNTGVSAGGNFVYLQGTDTVGWDGCQPNTARFGTEAFGGGYTSVEFQSNPCVNGATFYSSNSLYQTILEDTTHYRNGTPLVPSQPNPLAWWEETGIAGVNASDLEDTDLAIITTYVHDFNLGASDTLHYWTVLSTVRNGTLADLEDQVAYAKSWYMQTVRGCGGNCCSGRVGDANNSGEDEPTIGDVTVMIDAKFISGTCDGIIACILEADINQSGGAGATCEDVSIGDITILIDYLFITGQSLGLPNCL